MPPYLMVKALLFQKVFSGVGQFINFGVSELAC
jgi:hypothetical protein